MIFLAQTDTTAGFLSKDYKELNRAKKREQDQPCVLATAKFSELKNFVRVPQKFKNFVRRAKKTTFIYANSTLSLTALELGAESFEKSSCSESVQPLEDATSSKISLQNEPSLQNGEALEGSSQHDAETSVPQDVSAPKNKTSIISNSSSQKNEALALEISSSREPQEFNAPLKNLSLKKKRGIAPQWLICVRNMGRLIATVRRGSGIADRPINIARRGGAAQNFIAAKI